MNELTVGPELVGAKVKNAARPEWGIGTVLRVQRIQTGGQPVQRVSIQFAVGHRTLVVPPAHLVAPYEEPQRESGWLAGLSKSTLDDRLRTLPESVTQVFGSLRDRLLAVLPLYTLGEDSPTLLRWACAQTGVSDPLSHWTRDELLVAFQKFCSQRDAHLRTVAAQLKVKEGAHSLQEVIAAEPEPAQQAIRAALRQPI